MVTPTSTQSDDWQQHYLEKARLCLQQLDHQYEQLPPEAQVLLQKQIGQLKNLKLKLEQPLIQIAVFGFVSRGKSAVLNALLSDPIFPVGPFNGETQWPRSVRWSLAAQAANATEAQFPSNLQLELTDTPGLDEIDGQNRAQMAQEIAVAADLILFIVAGIPTPPELETLKRLLQAGRPLLLVVNKADLYPELTPAKVFDLLSDPMIQERLTPQEILLTAAAPAPMQVLSQWPDGHSETTWETMPPQVDPLRQRLLAFLNTEGRCVLTLNVLGQMCAIATQITDHIHPPQSPHIDRLIRRFLGTKAVLIAILPFFWLDIPTAFLCDLLLVGALGRQLGLPRTPHNVNQLWQELMLSLGLMIGAELLGALLFGLGNAAIFDDVSRGTALVSIAIIQAVAAAYGIDGVGNRAYRYFIEGVGWDATGPQALQTQLLPYLKPPMIAARLYR